MEDIPPPTQPSEFDAFESPRIPDEFLVKLVRMHRARARDLRYISWGSLLLTVSFVVAGIVFFVRGDPQKDLRADEEIKLLKQMIELDQQLSSLSREGATLKEKLSQLERAFLLAGLLGRLRSSVQVMESDPTWERLDGIALVTGVNRGIAKLLNVPPLSSTVIDVSAWFPSDTKRFSPGAIEALRTEAISQGVNVMEFEGAIVRFDDALRALIARKTPNDSGTINDALLSDVKTRIGEIDDYFAKLDQVKERIAARKRDLEQQAQEAGESAVAEDQKRQQLQDQRQQIKEQLDEFRLQREKIVFMAWLPDLTIRVGIVILLLFLTQVFLATYRYTLSLSSFYLARSDAIQMLQSTTDWSTRYELDQLTALTDALSPEGHRVDAVRDPTESLTELVKGWLGRSR